MGLAFSVPSLAFHMLRLVSLHDVRRPAMRSALSQSISQSPKVRLVSVALRSRA